MTSLTRRRFGRPPAPVRIVHLGIGNFARAHQAWYTEHAADCNAWGIAAFTGCRPHMAELLSPQDGLYTLITKHADRNDYEVISAISAVHPSSDHAALIGYFTSPKLALVTSTITAAGYHRTQDGHLNLDDETIAADLKALRHLASTKSPSARAITATPVTSVPARILAGLMARRDAGLGPLAILPCDNVPDNGGALAQVVTDLTHLVHPRMLGWMEDNVSWAACMADRITPTTTGHELVAVAEHEGYQDAAPVPTEPFREWIVSGEFPAGRPDWESAGASFIDAVWPYEQRKLWMLNGSHALLAYAGPLFGCETVAEAINHPRLRSWVRQWWQEAGSTLSVPWRDYARSLTQRYANPSISHLLSRIATDGSLKITTRIVPTLLAKRAQGELPPGTIRGVAAWLLHLRGLGTPIQDVNADQVITLVGGSLEEDAARVLAYVAPEHGTDPELAAAVAASAREIVDQTT